MSDRRYDDEETAAIFLTAAENPQAAPPRAPRNEGPTPAELQEIGREVGIPGGGGPGGLNRWSCGARPLPGPFLWAPDRSRTNGSAQSVAY